MSKKQKPIQSTQQNTDVKDFVKGCVVTKNNRFVKIMEIYPIPFFLKKIKDQNKIRQDFQTLLKVAPKQLHFKSVSLPADMSSQINQIDDYISKEHDGKRRKMAEDYRNKLFNAQRNDVQRKFYLSFCYEGTPKGTTMADIEDRIAWLDSTANKLRAEFNYCGNDVAQFNNKNDENYANAFLYHTLYNRNQYFEADFDNKMNEINEKYRNELNQNYYIPASDIIAPKTMDFSNKKYVVVDDTYYSFLYIPDYGYRSYLPCGWLDNFVNSFVGVDVDVFMQRISKENIYDRIRRSLARSRASLSETNSNTTSYDVNIDAAHSAEYLRNGIQAGEDFYYISTIITVSGKSPLEVDNKIDKLKSVARGKDFIFKDYTYIEEQAFKHTMPHVFIDDDSFFKKSMANCLSSGASSFYMPTTFQVMESDGTYIADSGSMPVLLDTFSRKRANSSIFLCGKSGAGKSTALQMLSLRSSMKLQGKDKNGRYRKMPVYIIAPEKEAEFKRITDSLSGAFISVGVGSSSIINVMEIFPRDEDAIRKIDLIDGSNIYQDISYLKEKISFLLEFFTLLIPDITIQEKHIISKALDKTYDKYGINSSNDSLWADKKHTRYKQMPILDDLVDIIKQEDENSRLSFIIEEFATGQGSNFNGRTNVDVNNEYVVFGLEHNKTTKVLAIYITLQFIMDKIKQDRTRKKMLIIDEWWSLAQNPIAAQYSLEMAKLLRSYSTNLCFCTQQMSDIFAVENGKYGTAVLNNCAYKIIMSLEDRDIQEVSEIVNLTAKEKEQIFGFQKGQALLLAGDIRLPIYFDRTEAERMLTATDSETLEEYVRMKEREQEQRELQELIANAPSFDEFFNTNESTNVKESDFFGSKNKKNNRTNDIIVTQDISSDVTSD